MEEFYRVSIEKSVYAIPCAKPVTIESAIELEEAEKFLLSRTLTPVREYETEEKAVAHAVRYVEWSEKKGFKPVVWDWDYKTAEDRFLITFTQPVVEEFVVTEKTIVPTNGCVCWDLGYVDDHNYYEDAVHLANAVLCDISLGKLLHPNTRYRFDD